jgi:hypothetical protein
VAVCLLRARLPSTKLNACSLIGFDITWLQIFCEVTKNTKAHLGFAALFWQKRAFAAKMPSFGNTNVKEPLIKPHFCSKWKQKMA